MIIVSQDKSTIVNFDNIVFLILQERAANISGEKETMIEALDKDLNEIVLAYYEEERAKEVLEEIAERYTNWNNLVYGQPTGECSPKYEMPKE